jgi:hypothetical protein
MPEYGIPTIGDGELEELTEIRERELARAYARRSLLDEAFSLTIWWEVQITLSPWQRVQNFETVQEAVIARLRRLVVQIAQLMDEEQRDTARSEGTWESV